MTNPFTIRDGRFLASLDRNDDKEKKKGIKAYEGFVGKLLVVRTFHSVRSMKELNDLFEELEYWEPPTGTTQVIGKKGGKELKPETHGDMK